MIASVDGQTGISPSCIHMLDIAVLIPCHNEQTAIEKVVSDFRKALPSALVFVYDCNSTDETAAVARAAGAVVQSDVRTDKGGVVRRMFADIEADIYVMVDGDDTYEAAAARRMILALLQQRLDMVNGKRVTSVEEDCCPGHRFGNWILATSVGFCFGRAFDDIQSGFRVFSRRFVKSFPAVSRGFEIETELTLHALELRMPVTETETAYKDRPHGSVSRLKTYSDGIRILKTIINLAKEGRPLEFFSVISAVLATLSAARAIPLMLTFPETDLVPRITTALPAIACMLVAFASLAFGLVLHIAKRARLEKKRHACLETRQVQTADVSASDRRFHRRAQPATPAKTVP